MTGSGSRPSSPTWSPSRSIAGDRHARLAARWPPRPTQVGHGQVWLLLSSGLVIDGLPWLQFAVLAVVLALAYVRGRRGAAVGRGPDRARRVGACSPTLGIGAAGARSGSAPATSPTEPDYGVSVLLAGELGVIAVSGRPARGLLIVGALALAGFALGLADASALANVEHVLGFVLGAGTILATRSARRPARRTRARRRVTWRVDARGHDPRRRGAGDRRAPRSRSRAAARCWCACAPPASTAPTCSSARAAIPPPPGAPPTSPAWSSPARSSRSGPGALRFAEGDRVMGIAGGGGQAELIAVHERQLMPVPDGHRVGRRRRLPRGLHHRARRAHQPVRPAARRAAARPRRGRRRRHRGRADRRADRRARDRHRAQPGHARPGRPRWAPRR